MYAPLSEVPRHIITRWTRRRLVRRPTTGTAYARVRYLRRPRGGLVTKARAHHLFRSIEWD